MLWLPVRRQLFHQKAVSYNVESNTKINVGNLGVFMPNHDSDAHKASSALVSSCPLQYCTVLISSLVFSIKCMRPEMLLIKTGP